MRRRLKDLLRHYDDYDYAASSWRRFGCSATIWFFGGIVIAVLGSVMALLLIKLSYVLKTWCGG